MMDFASKNEFAFRELGDRFRVATSQVVRASGSAALVGSADPFEKATVANDPTLTDETSSRFSPRAEREYNETLFRAMGSPTYEP